MLTTKYTKYIDFSFYWNDVKLEVNKPYRATVNWPNGTQETLDFNVYMEYQGYEDFPVQKAFLSITHNGFEGNFEIEDDPAMLALVVDLF